jgi:hypothetical protein
MSELKQKISDELYPFNRVKSGSFQIVKKDKTRLELTLINSSAKSGTQMEKRISLLCAVQYPKKGEEASPHMYINTRSFENYVANIKSEQNLQKLVTTEFQVEMPHRVDIENIDIENMYNTL